MWRKRAMRISLASAQVRSIGLVLAVLATTVAATGAAGRKKNVLGGPVIWSADGMCPNPFGVMLPSEVLRRGQGSQVAGQLGAQFLRPSSVFLDEGGGCVDCDLAMETGRALVLTVRANGRGGASSPPADLARYQAELRQALFRYRPALLAVENEENSNLFYSGSPEEYLRQLQAACQVAHELEIPCTNGGLVATLVALLVYDHYLRQGHGEAAQAFAGAISEVDLLTLYRSPVANRQLEKGWQLLRGYASAHADFVNFHWYFGSTSALRQAVSFLRAQSQLPVVSNEVGQWNRNPQQTAEVMQALWQLRLPVAIWFALDGPKAYGLVDADGNLRPTGMAFARFTRFLQQDCPRSYGAPRRHLRPG